MGTKCRAVARGVIASLTLTGLMLTGTASAHADQTLDTVLKRGKLVAGITYDSPPSGYLDAQGNVLGYCADVARYLAKRLGVGVEFVQITASDGSDRRGDRHHYAEQGTQRGGRFHL
jgi:ABC-type amino acid transport substrate-binding protein